jgi:hypothetical protein
MSLSDHRRYIEQHCMCHHNQLGDVNGKTDSSWGERGTGGRAGLTASAIHEMTSSLTHGRNCPNHRMCAMHEICIVSRCKMSVPRRQANRLLSHFQQ